MTDTSQKAFEAWSGTVTEKDNSPSNRRDLKVWNASRKALEAEQAQADDLRTQLARRTVERDMSIQIAACGEQAQALEPVVSGMTSEKAAYFMRRFKKEEKLLGPNEQKAIDYVLAMLAAAPQPPQGDTI